MDIFIQYLWNGLASGSLYALLAVGVTLIYGLSRIVNFAIGEYLMIGGLVTWTVVDLTGSWWLALVVAMIAAGVLGWLTERTVFRFTFGEPTTGFIVSLGLIFVLRGIAYGVWGLEGHQAEAPIAGSIEFAGAILENQTTFKIVVAGVAIVAFYVMLARTKFGWALRAVADDDRSAALLGIPVRRVIASTFVIGTALCGLAGWLVLTGQAVTPLTGSSFLLRGFAVALIGGLGNVRGAAYAGLGLGVVENLSIGYGALGWGDFYVFTAMVVILLIWPRGIQRGVEGARI